MTAKNLPPPAATEARAFLKALLNKVMRVKLTDGRILIGVFLCTDRDANVILGSCAEYVPSSDRPAEVTDEDDDDLDGWMKSPVEPRILGLAMVPGKHILSIYFDDNASNSSAPHNSPTHQAESAAEALDNMYL